MPSLPHLHRIARIDTRFGQEACENSGRGGPMGPPLRGSELLPHRAPKRSAARSRARAATSARSRGAAVVLNESISRRATVATSLTARLNAASFAFDGALNP